jgi:hypothetical protein
VSAVCKPWGIGTSAASPSSSLALDSRGAVDIAPVLFVELPAMSKKQEWQKEISSSCTISTFLSTQ